MIASNVVMAYGLYRYGLCSCGLCSWDAPKQEEFAFEKLRKAVTPAGSRDPTNPFSYNGHCDN